jgi:hypothetical protein
MKQLKFFFFYIVNLYVLYVTSKNNFNTSVYLYFMFNKKVAHCIQLKSIAGDAEHKNDAAPQHYILYLPGPMEH